MLVVLCLFAGLANSFPSVAPPPSPPTPRTRTHTYIVWNNICLVRPLHWTACEGYNDVLLRNRNDPDLILGARYLEVSSLFGSYAVLTG
jgi:hypothetical protein